MNVASLKLCKELFELSGWDITHLYWAERQRPDAPQYVRTQLVHRTQANSGNEDVTPAYDLGYLLRKLKSCSILHLGNDKYSANTGGILQRANLNFEADTPEDCATQLAIQLFKEGILK